MSLSPVILGKRKREEWQDSDEEMEEVDLSEESEDGPQPVLERLEELEDFLESCFEKVFSMLKQNGKNSESPSQSTLGQ